MSAGGIVEGNGSNSANKCASCRHQRRLCPNDCIFRPYFPLRKRDKFEFARRIFGVSNMERMLRDFEVQDRAKAVESIIWEASCWSQDSINGPLGCLKRLINSERLWEASCWSQDSIIGPLEFLKRLINSERHAKQENQQLRKQVYNLSRSVRTLIEEKQRNLTNEQLLKMEGSANHQVHAIPNSDIATNYYVDSEEGLELHSQGNSNTQCGSVNPQEIEGGRYLNTMLQSSPLPNHEINGTHVRDIGLDGCIGHGMPSNQHPAPNCGSRTNKKSRKQSSN